MVEEIRPGRAYCSTDVARLVFGHDVDWFYRWRAREGAARGFPPPVSDSGHPRWAGARLLAWMQGERAITGPAAGATIVDIRDILRQRSRGLAASRKSGLA